MDVVIHSTNIINDYNVSDFHKADTKILVPSFSETLTQGVGWGVGGKLKERGYTYTNNIRWIIIEKAREFQKNIYYFTDYAKAFDCVNHNKLWKIPQVMGIPDHLTHLLRNLYASQEATVRNVHGTTDWFQIRKRICQNYIVTLFI